MTPLYREVQRYRDLPPFTLLVVVGALFGWLLVVLSLIHISEPTRPY